MDRYQLATIAAWAGDRGIHGRKRLQKVVFFLQSVGCPLSCRFSLHHYGPYSRDVADVCDEMVAAGLLREQTILNIAGAQYNYVLAPPTAEMLTTANANNPPRAASMEPYRDLGVHLLSEELWHLELGSTILFFFQQSGDWGEALQGACEFKKVPANIPETQAALALAQNVLQHANHG